MHFHENSIDFFKSLADDPKLSYIIKNMENFDNKLCENLIEQISYCIKDEFDIERVNYEKLKLFLRIVFAAGRV